MPEAAMQSLHAVGKSNLGRFTYPNLILCCEPQTTPSPSLVAFDLDSHHRSRVQFVEDTRG